MSVNISPILYGALKQGLASQLPPGRPHSGTMFENLTVERLYDTLRQRGTSVFQPRYTLRESTFSGVAHQFDIVVRDGELTVVECKFREKVGIDQLFAFVGKLIDYRRRPQGIFLTTALVVGDEILCYAIAHRITLISTPLPPMEYLLERVQPGSGLAQRLTLLLAKQWEREPGKILAEWKNVYTTFCMEGYS